MKIDSLKSLCIEQLKDLHHAEQQLAKAMPEVIEAAKAPELKKVLEDHHAETATQVERLREIFGDFDERPATRRCRAMEGLLAETEELLADEMEPALRDAAIIAAAQRIEHYEMASYGAARTYAEMLGADSAARKLQQSLDEEGRANKTLKRLAREAINQEALGV